MSPRRSRKERTSARGRFPSGALFLLGVWAGRLRPTGGSRTRPYAKAGACRIPTGADSSGHAVGAAISRPLSIAAGIAGECGAVRGPLCHCEPVNTLARQSVSPAASPSLVPNRVADCRGPQAALAMTQSEPRLITSGQARAHWAADSRPYGTDRQAPPGQAPPARKEARSAREQAHSEPRRPENRPGGARRHFRRSGEQCAVAEGAQRDMGISSTKSGRRRPVVQRFDTTKFTSAGQRKH